MPLVYRRKGPTRMEGFFTWNQNGAGIVTSGTQYNFYDEQDVTPAKLPAGRIVRLTAFIKTAFNAGTTNTLIIGKAGSSGVHDDFATSAELAPTVVGVKYPVEFALTTQGIITSAIDAKIKYSWTGTAPTAGEIKVLFEVMEGW